MKELLWYAAGNYSIKLGGPSLTQFGILRETSHGWWASYYILLVLNIFDHLHFLHFPYLHQYHPAVHLLSRPTWAGYDRRRYDPPKWGQAIIVTVLSYPHRNFRMELWRLWTKWKRPNPSCRIPKCCRGAEPSSYWVGWFSFSRLYI